MEDVLNHLQLQYYFLENLLIHLAFFSKSSMFYINSVWTDSPLILPPILVLTSLSISFSPLALKVSKDIVARHIPSCVQVQVAGWHDISNQITLRIDLAFLLEIRGDSYYSKHVPELILTSYESLISNNLCVFSGIYGNKEQNKSCICVHFSTAKTIRFLKQFSFLCKVQYMSTERHIFVYST